MVFASVLFFPLLDSLTVQPTHKPYTSVCNHKGIGFPRLCVPVSAHPGFLVSKVFFQSHPGKYNSQFSFPPAIPSSPQQVSSTWGRLVVNHVETIETRCTCKLFQNSGFGRPTFQRWHHILCIRLVLSRMSLNGRPLRSASSLSLRAACHIIAVTVVIG